MSIYGGCGVNKGVIGTGLSWRPYFAPKFSFKEMPERIQGLTPGGRPQRRDSLQKSKSACTARLALRCSSLSMARWLHGREPNFKHEISRRHSVDNSPKLIGNKDKSRIYDYRPYQNKTLDNSPKLVTGGLGMGGATCLRLASASSRRSWAILYARPRQIRSAGNPLTRWNWFELV